MKSYRVSVVIEKDADGYFALCPALQGCYTQGNSYEEALENIKDAIRLHIEDRIDSGEDIPTAEPATLQDMIAGMPLNFNAEAAGDLQAVIQFDIGGEEPGQYYLQIAEGRCVAFEGKHPSPTLTIHAPSEVWMAISRGELDGTQAMMQGKYSIEGDLNLLIRFNELFSGAGADER
jgi:Uncharacterized conserved protein